MALREPAGGDSFMNRLNLLFELRRARDGVVPTNETVAQAIRDSGHSMTQQYLWKLRHSPASDPGISRAQSIADYFKVPLEFFTKVDVARNVVARELRSSTAGRTGGMHVAPEQRRGALLRQVDEMTPAQHQALLTRLLAVVEDAVPETD
ncbi:hypothetical protein [Kutzneria buriramensis]|uniref:HTH cro/C1-type domain-containing protein n=1 Tax=Kutzneria buriramensis TaxID=1045776 RepID=A0A3E0HD21_9PSEU|nr:hypothetical protein [Kutzneria buriramensis]REH42693.1 hypothetical protein BCF44_110190 [Kutzneria buriramensis]